MVRNRRRFRSGGILEPDVPAFRIPVVIRYERGRTRSSGTRSGNFGNVFRFDDFRRRHVAPTYVARVHHEFRFRVVRTYGARHRFAARGGEVGFGVIASAPALHFSEFRRGGRRKVYRRVTHGFAVVGLACGKGELEGAVIGEPAIGKGRYAHGPGSVALRALVREDASRAREDDARVRGPNAFDGEGFRSFRKRNGGTRIRDSADLRNFEIPENFRGLARDGKAFGCRRGASVLRGGGPYAAGRSDHRIFVFSGYRAVQRESGSGNVVLAPVPCPGAPVADFCRSGYVPSHRVGVRDFRRSRSSGYRNGRRGEGQRGKEQAERGHGQTRFRSHGFLGNGYVAVEFGPLSPKCNLTNPALPWPRRFAPWPIRKRPCGVPVRVRATSLLRPSSRRAYAIRVFPRRLRPSNGSSNRSAPVRSS